MGYSITTPLDTTTPGIETHLTQTINLNKLDAQQWTRLCNAAKTGLVTGGRGYLADLIRELVSQAGTLPPFIITPAGSWQGTSIMHPWMHRTSPVAAKVDELMLLSDTRHRLQVAALGEKVHPHFKAKRAERQTYSSTPTLTLPGWKSTTELRKYVYKELCSEPDMVAARAALLEYIQSKPTIQLVSKVF